MKEERYHATTQNRFYPDMFNVNKNITVEEKLISPPTYIFNIHLILFSHQHLDLPRILFPSGIHAKTLYTSLMYPHVPHTSNISPLFILFVWWRFSDNGTTQCGNVRWSELALDII